MAKDFKEALSQNVGENLTRFFKNFLGLNANNNTTKENEIKPTKEENTPQQQQNSTMKTWIENLVRELPMTIKSIAIIELDDSAATTANTTTTNNTTTSDSGEKRRIEKRSYAAPRRNGLKRNKRSTGWFHHFKRGPSGLVRRGQGRVLSLLLIHVGEGEHIIHIDKELSLKIKTKQKL